MAQPRTPLVHLAQGLLMGAADVVPGVSGGTVALIVGIYVPLVSSVRALAAGATRLLRGDLTGARHRVAEVQWLLVLPLAAGAVAAVAAGSFVIPPLLERFPVQMRAVFLGLVAASLAVPWRRVDRVRTVHVVGAASAAALAFVLVGLPQRAEAEPALLVVFAVAAVAICAMILPGVSGSFLLVVFGVYEATTGAVRSLDLTYLAVFSLGAAVGLGSFSRLLEFLLRRHHDLTMATLVGLMAGSLRALWPWLAPDRGLLAPPAALPEVAGVLVLTSAGFALVTLLTRAGARTEDRPLLPRGRRRRAFRS